MEPVPLVFVVVICSLLQFSFAFDNKRRFYQSNLHKLDLQRQKNEFEYILNSMPQGIMIARIKSDAEKRQEQKLVKKFAVDDLEYDLKHADLLLPY